jgi:hypothetical protein
MTHHAAAVTVIREGREGEGEGHREHQRGRGPDILGRSPALGITVLGIVDRGRANHRAARGLLAWSAESWCGQGEGDGEGEAPASLGLSETPPSLHRRMPLRSRVLRSRLASD